MDTNLIEALRDEQQSRCAYGTRDGDGLPCDCKYGTPFSSRTTSETTGCPELRAAIRLLTADRCSHCPPGCPSCWPPDCECYTHQDEPDRRDRSGVASIARGVSE